MYKILRLNLLNSFNKCLIIKKTFERVVKIVEN